MRLLVFTQKIAKNDPVLGFFHNWVYKLSHHFDFIYVICLGVEEYDLPDNVKVFSLGKERGVSKFGYVFNFFKFSFFSGLKYDEVFVHMNQEYVLLGGLFWKILNKDIFLWRNHPQGSIFTRIAVSLAERVLYTSPQSFTAKFKKGVLMPVGIDTDLFSPDKSVAVIPNSILSLGRISPIKNIDKIIEAANILDEKGVDFVLDIVGDPVNKEDGMYYESLVKQSKGLISKGKVNFLPAVSQEGAVLMYRSHKIFINLTPSGSMDKTILEAVSAGCISITSNMAYKGIFNDDMIIIGDPVRVEEALSKYIKLNSDKVMEVSSGLREYVLRNHSLDSLVDKLLKILITDQ